MAELSVADRALIEAGVVASQFLELDADKLDLVARFLPDAVFALAMLMVETDAIFEPRWRAAGTDWVKRGELIREAVLWVVTPEPIGPQQ